MPDRGTFNRHITGTGAVSRHVPRQDGPVIQRQGGA